MLLDRRRRRVPPRTILLVGVLTLGALAEVAAPAPHGTAGAFGDLVVGVVYLSCGPVLWGRAGSRPAILLSSVGAAWFLGSLWPAALFAHRGPLLHAVLAAPTGRVRRLPSRAVVAAGYLTAAVAPLGRSDGVTLLLGGALTAAGVHGYLRERGARRHARAAGTAATLGVALALMAGATSRLAGHPAAGVTLTAYEATLVLVALGLAFDLLRRAWVQEALTGLVVDLGAVTEPVALRDQLARALGDSSLQLGFWIDEEHAFVDEAGRRVVLPERGSRQVLTSVECEGRRIAVLVHDQGGLDDPALLTAAADAIRVAVTNVRLQATVRLQVEQLEASRRRIVEAAARQRILLARELEEGAAHRLQSVADQLASLREDRGASPVLALFGDVEQQLQAARCELEDLALGIHPAALTLGGLEVALPSLAERVSLPVEVLVKTTRVPAALEAAAYFVCSEALANAEKHAGAASVRVEAVVADGHLTITVHDDGAGGADPTRGSGLRGLADRVEALGGRLDLQSTAGHGTQVRAVIPVGAAA